MNVYLDLTRSFNAGRLRAIVSSGQAVVLHRLAIMSKDGDWIIREDAEAVGHVLQVLAGHGARYRLGAPLDPAWFAGGWSSHFEFQLGDLRVRTDFVSRPPRLSDARLQALWDEQADRDPPFVGPRDLVALKQTNREKDYAVIGELARLLTDPREQLLCSRSARDILALAAQFPELVPDLTAQRPLLGIVGEGRERVEEALDAERRTLMRENEARLVRYATVAAAWVKLWPTVQRETAGLPLPQAHAVICERAAGVLPFGLSDDEPGRHA
jgi:hypothetical protein